MEVRTNDTDRRGCDEEESQAEALKNDAYGGVLVRSLGEKTNVY